MMLDMHVIAETFSIMSVCLQPCKATNYRSSDWLGVHTSSIYDPHPEADSWIEASASDRDHLRIIADARHKRIMHEMDRTIRIETDDRRASARRAEASYRYRNRLKCKANAIKWREENREYHREYMKNYRAGIRSNPSLYVREKAANNARLREARAALRATNPLPPKLSKEERNERKRKWMREHRKPYSKIDYTPDQITARNAYQKRAYHAMTPDKKKEKLARKREAWLKRDNETKHKREEYLKNRRAA